MTDSDTGHSITEQEKLKEYHPPQLKCAGTLSDLTQGSISGCSDSEACIPGSGGRG